MAHTYLTEAIAIQHDGPYLFAGWSMGCYVALEMAVQAERSGREVGCLVLVAPPTNESRRWRNRRQARRSAQRVAELTAQLRRLGDLDRPDQASPSDLLPLWDLDDDPLAHAPDQALATTMGIARLRRERVNAANIAAAEAFRPGKRFMGPCVVVVPADEPLSRSDTAHARWRRLLSNPPTPVTLAATHHSIVRGEPGQTIGSLLEAQAVKISSQARSDHLESHRRR
jgi:thioesterase domain-containing protein